MESYAVRNAFIISFMQRSIEHQVAYKSMLGRHKLTSRIYSKIRLHHYGPSSLDLGSTWCYINTKLLYHADMGVCVTGGRERTVGLQTPTLCFSLLLFAFLLPILSALFKENEV